MSFRLWNMFCTFTLAIIIIIIIIITSLINTVVMPPHAFKVKVNMCIIDCWNVLSR
jgi:hypothetical protein